ncbi:MAG: hypothetical protein JW904_02085 [Spirochaetales bacterium]|nr:hypothetical protein [Spirochaetales bacterium]
MAAIENSFLYQIVDSGYFFTFTFNKFSVLPSHSGSSITLEYILQNRYNHTFMVPIDISHSLTLNCSHVTGFENDSCEKTWSKRVFNLTTKQPMYGHGNDHYVRFDPNDTKSFLVEFQAVAVTVAMIDMECAVLPEGRDYGDYRLRYNVHQDCFTGIYCLRTIPLAEIHKP